MPGSWGPGYGVAKGGVVMTMCMHYFWNILFANIHVNCLSISTEHDLWISFFCFSFSLFFCVSVQSGLQFLYHIIVFLFSSALLLPVQVTWS